ncbi:MAG TPA: iron-sulfur cluster assembly scaffold protein [Candidatus Acidoferrum sp.]|nr:iron-sulfur cluster assembly scaffold protein [Candidatus Acidoferrum sp.]
MFSQTVLDHFENPRNTGKLPGADAVVEVSNPVCGDVLQLAVTIESKKINAVRFLCRGCTAAIACGSLLTEQLERREVAVLGEITAEELARALGGLSEATYHAAQLAGDAVKKLVAALQKADSSVGRQ